jgi:hypothetical protein
MEYINLPWHDDALRHHLLHSGIYVAKIDMSRAVDDKSVGRWKYTLSRDEAVIVENVTASVASKLGYDFQPVYNEHDDFSAVGYDPVEGIP